MTLSYLQEESQVYVFHLLVEVGFLPFYEHRFFELHLAFSVEKILVDNGERMTKWYQDNLLKVNCDKYQAMVLRNPKEKGTLIWIYVAKKSNSHNPSRS